MTTAEALLPERGTEEYAMPSTVPAAEPSTKIQAKRSQRFADPGRSSPNASAPIPSRIAACTTPVTSTCPIFPRK